MIERAQGDVYVEGTKLNAATLLSQQAVSTLGLTQADPVPSDAFIKLKSDIVATDKKIDTSVSTINTQITTINNNITNLNTEVAKKENKLFTLSTASAITDTDYIPATKSTGSFKVLWSNIKTNLKTFFDAIYATKVEVQTLADEVVKKDEVYKVAIKGLGTGGFQKLTDAADWLLTDLNVRYQTLQYTTTGKNLFNPQPIVDAGWTKSGDTYSGAPNLLRNIILWKNTGIQPPLTLTFEIKVEYTTTTTSGAYFMIHYKDGTTATLGASTTFTDFTPLKLTMVKEVDYIDSNFGASANTTYWKNIQLEAGTTQTTFEPYTGGEPAPNPDFPQNIENIVAPQITTCGKNLCPNTGQSSTQYGITFVKNDDGTVTFSGTSTYHTNLWFNLETISLPAGTYTISGATDGSADTYYIRVGKGTGNVWFTEVYTNPKTITLNEPTILNLTISLKPNIAFDKTTVYMQLENASTASSYEQYKGQTVKLIGTTFRSLPDKTGDTLEKQNGVWGINRKVGSATYTGSASEAWTIYSGAVHTGFMIKCTDMQINGRQNGYSNRFIGVFTVAGLGTNGITFGGTADQNVYVAFSSERFPTVTDWKTWLASNTLITQYPLQTPIFQPLSADIQAQLNTLETYSGMTYIYTDSAHLATMDSNYIKDPNAVIKVMQDAIISLGGNI